MSINRAALYGKIHKVAKKYYKPEPPVERPVLEHLLYACCLENSRPEAANDAFAKLQLYADWNEVRVTSIVELAEVMASLTDPPASARRLKRTLQTVFENRYSFDLEYLRKQNLGKSVKEIEAINGVTPFMVAYVSQHGLGGHAIPANQGVLAMMVALGAISESEAAAHRIPGLERAIPKSKGIEFGSLLHQLGVDFATLPPNKMRPVMQEIAADFRFEKPETSAETGAPPRKRAKKAASTAEAASASKKKPRAAKSSKAASKPPKATSKRITKKKPK